MLASTVVSASSYTRRYESQECLPSQVLKVTLPAAATQKANRSSRVPSPVWSAAPVVFPSSVPPHRSSMPGAYGGSGEVGGGAGLGGGLGGLGGGLGGAGGGTGGAGGGSATSLHSYVHTDGIWASKASWIRRLLLLLIASSNMLYVLVTCPTSHEPRGWSKALP